MVFCKIAKQIPKLKDLLKVNQYVGVRWITRQSDGWTKSIHRPELLRNLTNNFTELVNLRQSDSVSYFFTEKMSIS